MNRLWLIGTAHHDVDGARRLEALLYFIKPDAITVKLMHNVLKTLTGGTNI